MAHAQFVQHRFVRISGPQHEADVLHRQGTGRASISDSEAKNDRRMTRMRTPFLKQKLRQTSLLYTGEKTNE